MADYNKRYRLDSIEKRNDGSEMIAHDIWAEAQPSTGGDWTPIPARHKTVLVPAAELAAALSAGGNGAIVAAYKTALMDNLDTQATPVTGWDLLSLEALLDANDFSSAVADAAVAFIEDTLGLTFPVSFAL